MLSIQKILVPVDFSEASTDAVHFAASLAQAHHARLYLLHVKAPFPVHGRIMAGSQEDVQRQHLEREKDQFARVISAELKNGIIVEELQVTGIPFDRVVVEMASKLGVDVIVIAAQATKGVMRILKKDLAQKVLRDAPCSVFVIRSPRQRPNYLGR